MTDWLAELEVLIRIYERPHEFTPTQVYTAVLNFLVHAPEHVAEAALLMGGERVKYIFRESEQQAAGE